MIIVHIDSGDLLGPHSVQYDVEIIKLCKSCKRHSDFIQEKKKQTSIAH